jgi:hypothetical protein
MGVSSTPQREAHEQRALARAGSTDDGHVPRQRVERQAQWAIAGLADGQRGTVAGGDPGRRGDERPMARQAGLVKAGVGQVPQLRQLPVAEGEVRRPADGAVANAPLDRLQPVAQQARKGLEPMQQRSSAPHVGPGHLEHQPNLKADPGRTLALSRLTLVL